VGHPGSPYYRFLVKGLLLAIGGTSPRYAYLVLGVVFVE
jgi:hypothetical protein